MSSINIIVIAAAVGVVLFSYWHFRRRYIQFTDYVCTQFDRLIDGEKVSADILEDETLAAKIQLKIQKLQEVIGVRQAESNNQKQQIQELVSDISHQLKTPLTNITMYQDMVVNPKLPEDKRQECLTVMKTQVDKLSFLIDTLLKMSKLESDLIKIKQEKVNLHDCLKDAVSAVAIRAGAKNIQISLACKDPTYLLLDHKWTVEAIFNLLENAVKYTPDGGKIEIWTEQLEMYMKINIKDTGIGISSEHFNDIFKRFFRESKVHNQEGAGIGLYLTRQIVMRQGGYLKVESKVGDGSIFSVYLLRENVSEL